MKKIFCICLCISLYSQAQINYVKNPGFEDYTQCPIAFTMPTFWTGTDTLGIIAGPYLAQYCNACVPSNSILSVPRGSNYHRKVRNGGQGYVYFMNTIANVDSNGTLLSEAREYLTGRLHQKLVANKNYCIKFFVAPYIPLFNSFDQCYSNNQAAYLDDGGVDSLDITWGGLNLPIAVIPQAINTSLVTDTNTWTKAEGMFTAQGIERFITIGNFTNHFSNTIVPYILGSTSYMSINFVDDVSVLDYDLPAYAGQDSSIALGDSLYIGRPHEIGPECRWWANGTALNDSNLGFWAKPTQPTQYVVQQKVCGNTKYDTIYVSIDTGVGIQHYNMQNPRLSIEPNPAHEYCHIQYSSSTQAQQLSITDLAGKEIIQQTLPAASSSYTLPSNSLAKGVYQVCLYQNGVAVDCKKLVVIH
jgi:hypothetical protein